VASVPPEPPEPPEPDPVVPVESPPLEAPLEVVEVSVSPPPQPSAVSVAAATSSRRISRFMITSDIRASLDRTGELSRKAQLVAPVQQGCILPA
jgi:hypothetical protein